MERFEELHNHPELCGVSSAEYTNIPTIDLHLSPVYDMGIEELNDGNSEYEMGIKKSPTSKESIVDTIHRMRYGDS